MFGLWSTKDALKPDEDVEASPPEESNTLSLIELRAAAAPLRAVTRATSKTLSTSEDGQLQLPRNPQSLVRNIS